MKEIKYYIPGTISAERQTALISVIVPVYNVAAYLPKCLDSILAQTYQKLEIILVDDASTDDSSVICDRYAMQDPRIRVLHKNVNEGLGAARNSGMALATGTYLTFVDSDDWIDAKMYEAMLAALLDTDADMAVCRFRSVYKDWTKDNSTGKAMLYLDEELLEAYVLNDDKNDTIADVAWNKLYKRSLADGMTFPSGINEDVPFTTKLLSRVKKCIYLDTAYYNYRRDRKDSIMNHTASPELCRMHRTRTREQICYLTKIGRLDLAKAKTCWLYYQFLYFYTTAGVTILSRTELHQTKRELWNEIQQHKSEIIADFRPPTITVKKYVRMRCFLLAPQLYSFLVEMRWKLVKRKRR